LMIGGLAGGLKIKTIYNLLFIKGFIV